MKIDGVKEEKHLNRPTLVFGASGVAAGKKKKTMFKCILVAGSRMCAWKAISMRLSVVLLVHPQNCRCSSCIFNEPSRHCESPRAGGAARG